MFIAENGSYVVCRGTQLHHVGMNWEDVAALVQEIRSREGCYAVISEKEMMYIETRDTRFLDLLVNGYHNQLQVVDDLLEKPRDIIKVSLYCESGVADLAQTFKENWAKRVRVAEAGGIWLDFIDYGADKGNALKLLQRTLQITPEETMVFGDNLNDMGMIGSAVHSYAVGNARTEVKEAARCVTASNEQDGVLQVLQTLL